MAMNNKGQAVFLAFMIAIVIILLALAFVPAVNQTTSDAMNETNSIGEVGGMNCTGTGDDFVKAACWTVDLGQGAFIGMLLALAGVLIGARLLWE